jgi:curved DNA-binding protein CbpA
MNEHSTTTDRDPFATLGIENTASEEEIRQRYLELVKQHPPEHDPVRFREIHDAYEAAKNPLLMAERLLQPSSKMPEWDDIINQQKKRPPALGASLLIALGNRSEEESPAEITAHRQSDQGDQPKPQIRIDQPNE